MGYGVRDNEQTKGKYEQYTFKLVDIHWSSGKSYCPTAASGPRLSSLFALHKRLSGLFIGNLEDLVRRF